VVGRKPEIRDVLSNFKQGCFFVFMGHGSGSQYISEKDLNKVHNL